MSIFRLKFSTTTASTLIFAAFVPTSGCAGRDAYDRGVAQLNEGDFDGAVSSFREAHDQWPEKQSYFDEWCLATNQAIQWHKKQASQRFKDKMLRPALEHVEKAIFYCDPQGKPIPGQPSEECKTPCGLPKGSPYHPHTLRGVISIDESKLAEAKTEIVLAIQEAEVRTNSAVALMQSHDWDGAVTRLRESTALDRSCERAKSLLAESINGAVNQHLKLATQYLEAESWDMSRNECKVVDSYRPGEQEARRIVKVANNRQKARGLESEAAEAVRNQEYLSAVDSLEQAVALWPEDGSIGAALTSVKNLAADALMTEARSRLASSQFGPALRLLDKASSLTPERADVATAITDAESNWADALLLDAESSFQRGQTEGAWIQSVLAS